MNSLTKLFTISASCAALIACSTGYAGEPNSLEGTNIIHEDTAEARQDRDESRAENRRERRMVRREIYRDRDRDRGSRRLHRNSIFISGDNGDDFWDDDTDEDGKISRQEYTDHHDRNNDDYETFDKIDANGDDFIEEEELEDFIDETVKKALASVDEALADMDFDFNFDFDSDHGVEFYSMEDFEDGDHRWRGGIGRHVGRSLGRAMRGIGRSMRGVERGMKHMEIDRLDAEEMEERMAEHRQRMLNCLDSDEDGTVSRDEFTARNDKAFDDLDENDDGVLSEDELSQGSLGPIMMQLGDMTSIAPLIEFSPRFRMHRGDGDHDVKIIKRIKKIKKIEVEEKNEN